MGDNSFLIGVDVGTGSVRAALVDIKGDIKKVSVQPINIWSPLPDFFQQSSDNIWEACCSVIRDVKQGISPESIKGIGFDATCSLVVVDKKGSPVSISLDGDISQNIIMWMDHRAEKQTKFINNLNHPLLKFVGGKISLEMEVPKLLWLKENLGDSWASADRFFDLPDFLTWKATGVDSRSLCSVVCKWMYEATSQVQQWNVEFYKQVGLEELTCDNFYKIGSLVRAPGELCGGLKEDVAKELGLRPGTPVATSIIDAHAGAVGMVGCIAAGVSNNINNRLSLICGTSTCHMAVSDHPLFVNGIWGPYYSAMVPGLWLNEAGQSATGKLIDHIIYSHKACDGIKSKIGSNIHIIEYLNTLLKTMALKQEKDVDFLTSDIHIWPDFHGNRSPIADSSLRGMICGLNLASDEEQLALLYLATIQALAYGTRHIMEVLVAGGYEKIDCVLMCGGLSKNELFVQTQANVVSRPVLVPQRTESVLLGSSMLAAAAAKIYPDVRTAIANMAGTAVQIKPIARVSRYHEKKYLVFKKMLEDQFTYRKMMRE